MRKYFFNNLFIISFFALLFNGCGEKIDPVVKTDLWQRDSIGTVSMLLNAQNIDGQFNVLGAGSYYKDVSPETPISNSTKFNLGTYSNSGYLKFPVLKNLILYFNHSTITIKSAASYPDQWIEKTINILDYDTEFYGIEKIPYWQGECIGANNEGYILMPYNAVRNGKLINTPRFLVIKLDTSRLVHNEIMIEYAKVFTQDDLIPGYVVVRNIKSFSDYFLIVIGTNTYRFDLINGLTLVMERPLTIAARADSLIGFNPNFTTSQTECFSSKDKGVTWNYLGSINTNLVDLNYSIVKDSLIGFGKSQLFCVQFKGNKFSVRELDDTGLPLSDITSLSVVNNTHVAVTNMPNGFSSVSGLYYRPLESFFKSKAKSSK